MQRHITPIRSSMLLGALVACVCATVQPAAAQQTATSHSALNVEGSKKLRSQAKISADSAAAIAVAKMPGETASSAKIEHHGKTLVYTVSLLKPGSKGVDRVWVDATNGNVVGQKHYGGLSGRVRHAHQAHEAKEATKEHS
jgi:hypothetical protein